MKNFHSTYFPETGINEQIFPQPLIRSLTGGHARSKGAAMQWNAAPHEIFRWALLNER
jgi:hypothetical protein